METGTTYGDGTKSYTKLDAYYHLHLSNDDDGPGTTAAQHACRARHGAPHPKCVRFISWFKILFRLKISRRISRRKLLLQFAVANLLLKPPIMTMIINQVLLLGNSFIFYMLSVVASRQSRHRSLVNCLILILVSISCDTLFLANLSIHRVPRRRVFHDFSGRLTGVRKTQKQKATSKGHKL